MLFYDVEDFLPSLVYGTSLVSICYRIEKNCYIVFRKNSRAISCIHTDIAIIASPLNDQKEPNKQFNTFLKSKSNPGRQRLVVDLLRISSVLSATSKKDFNLSVVSPLVCFLISV